MNHHCRDAFDRLTEFSNILLENGDYHVHTNQKEQLQHDLHTHVSGIRAGMDPNAGVCCMCSEMGAQRWEQVTCNSIYRSALISASRSREAGCRMHS